MKITGVAPQIAILTFLYMFLVIIIDYSTIPFFNITNSYYPTFPILGIILILIGIIMIFNVAKKLRKSFISNILMTDGLYRIFRNPMYVAYLIFIIPGICFFFNSWLVFTSIIINFILFQIFIQKEYKYLANRYGEEYKIYLSRVWIKFL